ncbi:MAG: flagellar basal body rod protein FlgC [Phycisphaerae bacterium]
MIRALETSQSALVAQRVRMDVIAGNIANASTTRQADGTPLPYRRRFASFVEGATHDAPGVRVDVVGEDESPFQLKYDPGHPDAIQAGPNRGYVQFPNVNVTMEYVDALAAGRAYEANVAMLNLSRQMIQRSLRLFA